MASSVNPRHMLSALLRICRSEEDIMPVDDVLLGWPPLFIMAASWRASEAVGVSFLENSLLTSAPALFHSSCSRRGTVERTPSIAEAGGEGLALSCFVDAG